MSQVKADTLTNAAGTGAPDFPQGATATGGMNASGGLAGAGVTNNSSAPSGYIGEYVEASVTTATANFGNGVAGNIASISLTAGDWDVTGFSLWNDASITETQVGQVATGLSTISASLGVLGDTIAEQSGPCSSFNSSCTVPTKRFSLSTTTTVYLVGEASFSAGNPTYRGRISARRAR